VPVSGPVPKTIVAIALVVLLVPAWLGVIDSTAQSQTQQAFERALVSFAVARTLNGVISVAQGTELAFQPAGVGIVVTAGEILDPLNDLIEQFSWLTLLAATSLGAQILLAEMFATPFANAVLTIAVILALTLRFVPAKPFANGMLKIAVALALLRFMVAIVALTTSAIASAFLVEREQASVAFLSETSAIVEQTADAPRPPTTSSPRGALERFGDLLDDARAAVDLDERLAELKQRVESAIGHVVNLIVVYLVETVLLPLTLLAVAWGALRGTIRRLNTA